MTKSATGEKLRKTCLYLKSSDAYWRPTDYKEPVAVDFGALGPYPLDLRARLNDGHYDRFDSAGVPVRSAADGSPVYFVTTMTSCALARWHMFVTTGDEQYLHQMLAIADHLLKKSVRAGGELHLLDAGRLSAMNQGEAMSVLIRAYKATGKGAYCEAAHACFGPFRRLVRDGGVIGLLGPECSLWLEETTRLPLHHILNGMIYSMWGIMDINVADGNRETANLLDAVLASLRREVRRFDLGWWSRYWIPDGGGVEYLASIMYQALHIAQLEATSRLFECPDLAAMAARFAEQIRSIGNRARHMFAFAVSKRRLLQYRSRQPHES